MAKSELRFRTPYDLPHERFSDIECPDDSRTKQSEMDGCDINLLLKRYETTGVLPDMIKSDPQYGDFSEAPEYQEALHVVQRAEEQFQNLSAKVRARFNNDPVAFLEWVGDGRNAEEMAQMGLMSAEAVKRVQDAKDAASKEKARAALEPKGKAKKDEDTES